MITEYRGKDLDGKWTCGYLILVPNLEYGIIISPKAKMKKVDTYDYEDPLSFSDDEISLVEKKSIGMWTGRYDINKTKIYEGDIIKCTSVYNSCIELTSVVSWNPDLCRFDPFSDEGEFEYKVVGNMLDLS